MANHNETKNHAFPSDFVHPSIKEDKDKWGLPLARAIYYGSQRSGSPLFFNDRQLHKTYKDYALGDQNVSQYKPILGINPKNANNNWVSAIRWAIKNYATKRVNIAVSKIADRDYDAIVECIDQLAIDQKEDYKARLKVYNDNQAWLAEMSKATGMSFAPEGAEQQEEIPTNTDEFDLHMDMNVKIKAAIRLEKGLKDDLERNNYKQIKRQVAFDLFVIGIGAVWAGMDENMKPVIKRVDPSRLIVPYSETPDFDNMPYGGQVMEMSIADFKKMAANEFSPEELEDIANRFSKKNDLHYAMPDDIVRPYDVNKISIMHFEYMTTNEMVYVDKPDAFGNKVLHEQDYNYYKTPQQQEKFKQKYGDTRKLHRTPYQCVYEGYWIVDSEYVFKYGKKSNQERKKGTLSETSIGYKVFAPNMFDGRIVSTVKQMIPILDELQSYHIKKQHIIAKAIPKGMGIDLFALRKANFKWGGKDMSDQDKLEMFMQSGIFIYDSSDRYAPGSNYRPFIEAENGMAKDILSYLNLINQALTDLDEIIGINKVSAASNLSPEVGKGVAEMQVESSEVALDYLYDADKSIFHEVVKSLGILHVQSVKYGKGTDDKTFGKISNSFVTGDSDVTKYDYGFRVEVRPTKAEWNDFYFSLKEYVKMGIISPSDEIFIREVDNLKEAKRYLAVIEKRKAKQASMAKQQDMEMNAQAQQQSLAMSHEATLKEIETKGMMAIELEKAKMESLKLEYQLEIQKLEKMAMLQAELLTMQKEDDTMTEIGMKTLGHHFDMNLANAKNAGIKKKGN